MDTFEPCFMGRFALYPTWCPMRLTLVVTMFPSVSETFIFRKAVGLAARGHEVHLITHILGDWKPFQSELPLPPTLSIIVLPQWKPYNVRASFITTRQIVLLFLRLGCYPVSAWKLWLLCYRKARPKSALRQFVKYLPFLGLQPDIIHFEFLGVAANYPLMGEWLNVPIALSCRGADLHLLEQRHRLIIEKYTACLRQANAVHCVSDEMALEVTRLSGRTEGIWVNRPAVAVEQISMRPMEVNGVPPKIIAVGRLVWKKGFDYLLAALLKIKQQQIDFIAEIVGGGPLYEGLKATVSSLGLSECVILSGPLPPVQVVQRLQQSDIFVLSSHEEGISNAFLEAMAVGLPVITFDVGGMREAILDGREGYIVPARDVARLAERIADLLKDNEQRKQMGMAARQRVETEFALQRQVETFEQMYFILTQ
ncbi:MAG: glycosyltransferase family 4 protein [Chloroflexi bacterium]|nr:glycosyltransferase family 4 protein [Chloroflexota bacterium]